MIDTRNIAVGRDDSTVVLLCPVGEATAQYNLTPEQAKTLAATIFKKAMEILEEVRPVQ